jgi:glycosyltransferase involved in cell wall biosynthesis
MIRSMKISVIIPVLNAVGTIRRTIESVLAQELHECEVIVVDNGSTDMSIQVIEEFGDRISLVHCTDPGAAHCRNLGASIANQKVLAFLDAGDTWEINKLALQKPETLQENELRGCYATFRSAAGRNLGSSIRSHSDSDAQAMARTASAMPCLTSTWMISRIAFFQNQGFDPQFKNSQDLDFINRFAISGGSISVIRECLVNYELNPKSLTAIHYKRQYLSAEFIRDRAAGNLPTDYSLNEYLNRFGRFPSRLWRLSKAGSLFRSSLGYRARRKWLLFMIFGVLSTILSPTSTLKKLFLQSRLFAPSVRRK